MLFTQVLVFNDPSWLIDLHRCIHPGEALSICMAPYFRGQAITRLTSYYSSDQLKDSVIDIITACSPWFIDTDTITGKYLVFVLDTEAVSEIQILYQAVYISLVHTIRLYPYRLSQPFDVLITQLIPVQDI